MWNDIFPATTGIIALLATFGITKSLVDSYDIDGLPAGAIAVAAFFLLNTLDAENNMWNADLFGAVNMFTGIIVALVVGRGLPQDRPEEFGHPYAGQRPAVDFAVLHCLSPCGYHHRRRLHH